MSRDLLCTACLAVVEVESSSWAETMTLHVLDSPASHPRMLAVVDIDAAFDGIVRHSRGQCRLCEAEDVHDPDRAILARARCDALLDRWMTIPKPRVSS